MGEIFGETTNSKGYKEIHPTVGYIYGDSITIGEQERILSGQKANGYVSTIGVLGMGSYLYEYVTRDTFGFVCKATFCEVNGEPRNIFKSPKTGGWKKSHKGLLRVNEDFSVTEECAWAEEKGGLLQPVFHNGSLTRVDTLASIRERLQQLRNNFWLFVKLGLPKTNFML